MMPKELRKMIFLIGVLVLGAIIAQNIFIALSPIPDSPEMARAKAKVFEKESDARLQFEWMKHTLFMGLASLLSGALLVGCSLWAATKIVKHHSNIHDE